MTRNVRSFLWGLILTGTLFIADRAEATPPRYEITLTNLIEAHNGELNAESRYLAWAERAEADGCRGVASLFRAVAMAERVHATNQERVIRQLGGTPQVRVVAVVIGDTRQNLQDAQSGERYERETMYPEFIAAARREGLTDVSHALEVARLVEAEHADLFADALQTLESEQQAPRRFAICSGCGRTRHLPLDDTECDFCQTPAGRFAVVQ